MFIEWRPDMTIGIELIDEEHGKLVSFLNQLHADIEEHATGRQVAQTLSTIMAYTVYHFNHEEALFLATDYPDKRQHIAEHKVIVEKLADFKKRLESEESERVAQDILALLKGWLVDHIQKTDIHYVNYLRQGAA